MDSNLNEPLETDFNSTLQEDGKLFSSHTVNTLSLIDRDNNKLNTILPFEPTKHNFAPFT